MEQQKPIQKYVFMALFLFIAVLAYLVLRPYFTYILLGLILLFAFRPLNTFLHRLYKQPVLASITTVLIVLLLIVVPSFFVMRTLVDETSRVYSTVITKENIDILNAELSRLVGEDVDLSGFLFGFAKEINTFLISFSVGAVNQLAEIVIGLFIMFFLLYYGFKKVEGPWKDIAELIPLNKQHKQRIFKEIEDVTSAVIYGQAVAALAQGVIGGLFFWIFGIPNPIFWGLLMAIFSFIPFLGTPMIWIPAGIIELVAGNTTGGVLFLILNAVITTNVDNLIKPYAISSRSRLHPVIVVIGVFGGISAFGIVGILLGPLILALLIIFLEEYLGVHPTLVIRKQSIRAWLRMMRERISKAFK